MEILTQNDNSVFDGCDFVVRLPIERKGTPVKLLQLTDMQMINARQRRYSDRIRVDEINAWQSQNLDALCGNHIRSLVAQTKPDAIFITGDITYGSFDDDGSSLKWFCQLMDSFEIPWAPVFGNHDNESKMGVAWQCQQFENSPYCLFKRGTVTGNGNYTVGVAYGEELQTALFMLDSNGCFDTDNEGVVKNAGIYPDQLAMVRDCAKRMQKAQNKVFPALAAFHIPTQEFAKAEEAKGYTSEENPLYTIGVTVPQVGDDFGMRYERLTTIPTDETFMQTLKESGGKGAFAGHFHRINTCIEYQGIRFVFGLKTGQYDSHVVGALGGTLVQIEKGDLHVQHIPALIPYGPYPGKSPLFNGLFSESEILLEEN